MARIKLPDGLYYRKGSKVIQIRIKVVVNGVEVKVRQSSGTTNVEEAERLKVQLHADILNGTYKPTKARKSRSGGSAVSMTIGEACDRAMREMWPSHKSRETYFRPYMKSIVSYFGADYMLVHLDDEEIASWIAEQQSNSLSSKTIKDRRNLLRQIMARAYKVWKVPVKPIDWIHHKVKVIRKGEAFFFTEEHEHRYLQTFLKNDNQLMFDLCVVLVETGLRIGELLALTGGEIDWMNRTIRVRAVELGAGKTSTPRTVPLTERAFKVLWNRRHEKKPFDITYNAVRLAWTRAREQVGDQAGAGVSLHAFRHTCASRMAMSGVATLKDIQSWLGHSDIQMTNRYTHLLPGHLGDIRDALDKAKSVSKSVSQMPDLSTLKGNRVAETGSKTGSYVAHNPKVVGSNPAPATKNLKIDSNLDEEDS